MAPVSDMEGHLAWLTASAHGVVLEIGVREGHSTRAILKGLRIQHGKDNAYLKPSELDPCSHHLYSVDKDDPLCSIDDPNWTFIRADSRTESDRILDICGRADNNFRFDLLLIDGDHSYAGCMADLTSYGKWANVIAVHDTESAYSGVWEALIAYYRCQWNGPFRKAEFFNHSHGLGVLYR